MTPLDYSKRAQGILAFILAIPFLSGIFNAKSALPFPPLGDGILLYKLFSVVIGGCLAFLPFYLPNGWRHGRFAIICLAMLIISVLAYVAIVEPTFVVPIPRPEGTQVFVVRGSERSPDLQGPYRSMSDARLIQETGQSDERLSHAYTRGSLARNRLLVFGSYESILGLLVLFVGLVADTPAKP